MIDQDYVKSMDAWFKNLELTIHQVENDLAFHKKEIELHTAHIELCEAQIEHDRNRLAKHWGEFAKYLEENTQDEAR